MWATGRRQVSTEKKKEFASVFIISIDFLCAFSFFVNTTFNHIFLSNKFDWKFYFKRAETLRKKTYFRCVRKILTEPHILACAKKKQHFLGRLLQEKKATKTESNDNIFGHKADRLTCGRWLRSFTHPLEWIASFSVWRKLSNIYVLRRRL